MKREGSSGKPRIVFMGTPAFAVGSLEKLLKEGYEIAAVVTAPDKPAGRGLALQESEVKKFAVQHGLRILQPEKLKDPAFIETLRTLKPDIQVVVAFRMLPEVVWSLPPMGTINVHASLLPRYRGAAPINWAIMNGEKETGVTTFRLKHEIDTGDILLKTTVPITEDETAGSLHDKLKEAGAGLLIQTLKGLEDSNIRPQPQDLTADKETLPHAPKIFSETCLINWNKTNDEVFNHIRGLAPYPSAFTMLDDKKLRIFSAAKLKDNEAGNPGEIVTDKKTFLRFRTTNGLIDVKELQLEGRKKMKTEDFLRGYRFA